MVGGQERRDKMTVFEVKGKVLCCIQPAGIYHIDLRVEHISKCLL